MMRLIAIAAAGLALTGCVIADVTEIVDTSAPSAIQRAYASPTAFYAKHIVIPPGYATIRLPGIIPDADAFGADTEAQAESVFRKIAATLQEAGASEADVVAMTVYLVKPQGAASMDFDGMMRAYGRHYGSATQPNRPVRSTVEVAGLVRPDMLVEIEVTAAVPAQPAAR